MFLLVAANSRRPHRISNATARRTHRVVLKRFLMQDAHTEERLVVVEALSVGKDPREPHHSTV